MKPFIIFGAGGFVGKHVLTGLLEKGCLAQGFSTRDADLTDPGQAMSLTAQMSPEAIWVITSVVRAKHPEDEKAVMLSNLRMAVHLTEMFKPARVAHVIFLSSIDVYGRHHLTLPLSESSLLRPENYYAVSKLSSEKILEFACQDAGIPLTILRLPGIYGPGDRQWGPVRSFVRAALLHEPIRVHGNGEQRRDLLYVGDLPEIVEAMGARTISGVYNAVTGSAVSLNKMIGYIERLAGRPLPIQYEDTEECVDICFSTPRLRQCLPDVRFTTLETGISKLYTYFLESGDTP